MLILAQIIIACFLEIKIKNIMKATQNKVFFLDQFLSILLYVFAEVYY
jgi:hypothetical protein